MHTSERRVCLRSERAYASSKEELTLSLEQYGRLPGGGDA